MKRILILTSDYGHGHRRVADAIAKALKERHGQECTVEVVNPMEHPDTPALFRENQNDLDQLVREAPELYEPGHEVAETWVTDNLVTRTWALMLFGVLREIILKKGPDIIVCTYPLYQSTLAAVFKSEKRSIPVLTVITDLADVHNLWFHPVADLCLVPTQTVYNQAIEARLSPEKVKVTGVPVRPDLAKATRDRDSIRQNLGWRQDLFTVLAIGGQDVDHLYDSLQALNRSGLPLQLVIATGGDQALFKRFQETGWQVETHVYDFVVEMGAFMRAADCVLSKAGSLTVSEALASGLPLILIDVVPGQETVNADYVISGDAGVRADDPGEVFEAMCQWLENDRLGYKQQAKNARRLGRPRAAYDVAEFVWAASPQKGKS